MGDIEKLQEYIKEIKTKGFKQLDNNFRLTKKHLNKLNTIVADVKLGGSLYNEVATGVNLNKLVSEGAEEAFDAAIVDKILMSKGEHGLGQFKTSNLENIGPVENIGGVKSKQIFKQSKDIADLTADVAIGKELNRKYARVNKVVDGSVQEGFTKLGKDISGLSDNELRLTKQYFTAKNKGLSDKMSLDVTKSGIKRIFELTGTDIVKTLPSVGNTAAARAAQKAAESSELLEAAEKESELYGSKYYPPADAHVKEYNLVSVANQSEIGKKVPFISSAEVKEYNKMVKDFDKIPLTSEARRNKKLEKDLDTIRTIGLEESKVGLTELVNPTAATETSFMAVENFGDMQIGGSFTNVGETTLEQSAKAQYETAYGNKTIPINFRHPTAQAEPGVSIGQLGFKVGDDLPIGVDKTGKMQFLKVGPEVDAAQPNTTGIVSFGKDMTEPRYPSDIKNERASKTKPGRIEMYDIAKQNKEAKSTYVPRSYPEKVKTVSKGEFKTAQSLVGQMNTLKAMYPNVANSNNLVRLAIRNMEKGLGMPANPKLLKNLSKFF